MLFLDDDMLCDSGLVAAHIAAHKELAPSVTFGALFLSPDSPPSLAAECFQREIGAFHVERKQTHEVDWQITDCVFSNASLPRALLDDLGGFDESFRMREDLDLGFRLFRAGVRPVYLSSAITHQQYQKTTADLIRDAEVFAAGDVLFARKYPDALIEGHLTWLALESRGKLRKLGLVARVPAMADLFSLRFAAWARLSSTCHPLDGWAFARSSCGAESIGIIRSFSLAGVPRPCQ